MSTRLKPISVVPLFGRTRVTPLEAHLAHLRHLSKTSVLMTVLRDSHGYLREDSNRLAGDVAPFIRKGIDFHDASTSAPEGVRPVLQYYSALNFAVAVILIRRPLGWEKYKHHGAGDLSHQLRQLSLSSKLIQIRDGAINLFNVVVSGVPLVKRKYSFGDVIANVPSVATEAGQVFGLTGRLYWGQAQIENEQEGDDIRHRMLLKFTEGKDSKATSSSEKVQDQRLRRTFPSVEQQFGPPKRSQNEIRFLSKESWAAADWRSAVDRLAHIRPYCLNLGIEFADPDAEEVHFPWRLHNGRPVLPALTASLMLSFALSSLCRYRAGLLGRVSASKANLILDSFTTEASACFIPAFRNYLYNETLYFAPLRAL